MPAMQSVIEQACHPKWIGVAILVSFLLTGCQPTSSPEPAADSAGQFSVVQTLKQDSGDAILAQGQIKPRGGIVSILAPPGDRLEEIMVEEGDQVEIDQPLARLASQAAREGELEVAKIKLREAKQAKAALEQVAQAKLQVAEVGLAQARLKVRQAEEDLAEAKATGGRFDLLSQQVELAETQLGKLREASNDPTGGRLVSSNALEQQQLKVNQARGDLRTAKRQAEAAIEAGQLAVQSAEEDLRAARLEVESASAGNSLDSLAEQIKLLELQVEATRILSPIAGTILSIDAKEGQATSGMPWMRIANLQEMVVKAEVNVASLRRVKRNARALITSPAFEGSLEGRVETISQMIGSPTLPSPNPMAKVDYRTVEVTIVLSEDAAKQARQLINLQVEVAIAAEPRKDEPTS